VSPDRIRRKPTLTVGAGCAREDGADSGGVIVLRILLGLLGAAFVAWALLSALKTVVLPRAESSILTRWLFITLRRAFDVVASPKRSFGFRDRLLAYYAPVGLFLLPALWVTMVLVGFAGIFWATGSRPWNEPFIVSGSSLFTLGFDRPAHNGQIVFVFVEAAVGLGIISLVISYLPTIYGAFNRRERLVGLLEVRAGLPPSPAELLVRYARIGFLDRIDEELFPPWEQWFADIEESHTSQASLVFLRSPHPRRSWITAAGCVLDTAAITNSLIAKRHDARADVMLRTGFFCLRRIADYFAIDYDPNPRPDDPITVTRREFDLLAVELEAAGVPLKADRDQAWRDYAGWRVNYDRVLVALCGLTVAPPGKWSSDRLGDTRTPLPPVRRRTAPRA
jgi:hypothetical protein